MNKSLLVIGGTSFIGRNFVERVITTGKYEITLFNRGLTNPELFPNTEMISGDRETNDIEKIGNRDWDFIVDFSSYFPESLKNLLDVVNSHVERYIYISTISVYDFSISNVFNEYSNTMQCSEQESYDTTPATYGKRKAECERVLLSSGGFDKLIFRPSIVYGNYDPTERLYYWLFRYKTRDKILIPSEAQFLFNMTYVNDMSVILEKALSIEDHGIVYNLVTHDANSFSEKLEAISKCENKKPGLIKLNSFEMSRHKIFPEIEFPLWTGEDIIISNENLVNSFGNEFTPFEKSICETYNFYDKFEWKEGKAGMRLNKEDEIISKLTK